MGYSTGLLPEIKIDRSRTKNDEPTFKSRIEPLSNIEMRGDNLLRAEVSGADTPHSKPQGRSP